MSDPLAMLAARQGVLSSYTGLDRKRHRTSRETQIAILAAMGMNAETEVAVREHLARLDKIDVSGRHPSWQVETAGRVPRLDLAPKADWQLQLEDGTLVDGRGATELPILPLGRHLLTVDGRKTWLLAAPRTLPRPPRAWGVTAPLAGLRSPRQGGIGDFEDLCAAALALSDKGASFLGINPVHAGFPTDETALSPYSPSHRQWLNTTHIATGAPAAATGPLIDYRAEIRAHSAALRAMYEAVADHKDFEAYLGAKGEALMRFATHQALSDRYGPYWCDWPHELRRADAPEVARAAESLAEEIRFHAWAQFQAELQLARTRDRCEAAGMAFGLYLDLAVGTHPFGAETWENPTLYAQGVSLGAPPDAFAQNGQSWTLAPPVPRAMEAEGFATLAATLRRQFQFAKLLRIDHILGFDRAYWAINQPALPGAYVKMPLEAMLAVTRIEAARARATVVGEDLGNIPAGLQSALKSSGLLGYRLIVFEHDVQRGGGFKPPQKYDVQTLGSFSSHDLPTWRGWRKGTDIAARRELGDINDNVQKTALAQRKAEVKAFDRAAGDRGLHGYLAESAAQLVAVQIENALDVETQPNLPGTIDEYPNWRQRLPIPVSDYAADPRLDTIATAMKSSGRGTNP